MNRLFCATLLVIACCSFSWIQFTRKRDCYRRNSVLAAGKNTKIKLEGETEIARFTGATKPNIDNILLKYIDSWNISNSNCTSFSVFGKPMALSRHRTTKSGMFYNPCQKLQSEFLQVSAGHLPTEPIIGPIHATILFYFQRPKNHYSIRKNSTTLKTGVEVFYNHRSGEGLITFSLVYRSFFGSYLDLDNLVKFVLDALNKRAYLDDSQITILTSAKVFTDGEPMTTVILQQLPSTIEDYAAAST